MEDYKKKYNEALEIARKINSGEGVTAPPGWTSYEVIFPELKENEDEKIRKEILNVFKQLNEGTTICGRNYDYAKWIAWLEKQKDYIKLPNSTYTSNKDVIEFADKYSHTVWGKLMDNFKIIENYSIGCNDVSDIVLNAIINTYNWLEKHGEKNINHTDIKEKAHQIAWETSKDYDPLLSKESWCEMAALDMASWLESKTRKKSADEVMKIRRKAYSDGYKHGQDNVAISLGKESIEALEHFVRSIGESGYASPYDNRTKLVYKLLEQLKQIVK